MQFPHNIIFFKRAVMKPRVCVIFLFRPKFVWNDHGSMPWKKLTGVILKNVIIKMKSNENISHLSNHLASTNMKISKIKL